VQQHGATDFLDHFQGISQTDQIMTIDRADISEAHLFEQHSPVQEAFQSGFELGDGFGKR
jgi:hypothetical protein